MEYHFRLEVGWTKNFETSNWRPFRPVIRAGIMLGSVL